MAMEGAIVAASMENQDDLSVLGRRISQASFLGPTANRLFNLTPRQSPRPSRQGSVVKMQGIDEMDKGPPSVDQRVTLNVSGMKFEVPLSTLAKHPNTLLGDPLKLHRFYDPSRNEYYFNRNRMCFESILQYYQLDVLRRPNNARLDTFVEECIFFELDSAAFLEFCQDEGFEQPEPEPLPKNPIFRKIWQLVEIPQSSMMAKIFAIFSTLFIVLSIVVFCVETMPEVHAAYHNTSAAADPYAQFHHPLFIIESICIGWFTLEFLVRLITCPDKKKFFKSFLNIVDFVAIVPYYIDLGITLSNISTYGVAQDSSSGSLAVLRILRLVRVFRIFKLSRHSRGLQILGQTFVMSVRELGLLLLFLGMGVVLFSSSIYYAENHAEETQFVSIPEGFWWAIVTMTTVGYGDVAPKSPLGKVVGTACAVSGLIAIALPVPVIVANFNTIYQREKERPQVEEILNRALDSQQNLRVSSDAIYKGSSKNGHVEGHSNEKQAFLNEHS